MRFPMPIQQLFGSKIFTTARPITLEISTSGMILEIVAIEAITSMESFITFLTGQGQ